MRIVKRCRSCGHEVAAGAKDCPTHGGASLAFVAVVDLPRVGGKRRRKKRTFAREREAKAWAASLESQVRRHEYSEPSEQRLDDYLDGWLEASELRIKPSTLASYRTAFAKHIVPAIGHLRLREITAPDLRAIYAAMVRAGLSAKTARNTHVAARKALGDAVRDGLLTRNPADAAFDLKVTKPRIRAWGPDDLSRFLAAIEGHKYARLFELMSLTGLRRGEGLGIPWSAVDLDATEITIEQTLIRDGDNGVAISPTPKSEESRRVVELDAGLVALIRAQRKDQLERRMTLGDGWTDTGLVFDRGDGRHIDPDVASQDFAKIVARAELPPLTIHQLRHTLATLMIEGGESIKVVQETLGHASASTTMDTYSSVRSGEKARAAAEIRKRITGS